MSASMVRLGGIMAFVVIAVAIIGGFLGAGSKVVSIIINLITTALVIFVFWTTKALTADEWKRLYQIGRVLLGV